MRRDLPKRRAQGELLWRPSARTEKQVATFAQGDQQHETHAARRIQSTSPMFPINVLGKWPHVRQQPEPAVLLRQHRNHPR